MKRLFAGLALASMLGASAQAAAPVNKIQAMLAKPEQLCGRFEQSKQLAGMKKPLASSGRFCVVAGKGVLWRTLKPFPNTLRLSRDEIVQLQGERVAMRMEASREPTVRMINGVLFSLLSGDLGQLDTLFDVDGTAADGSW
jgi:outer membrane lipoprotein-sorting protein